MNYKPGKEIVDGMELRTIHILPKWDINVLENLEYDLEGRYDAAPGVYLDMGTESGPVFSIAKLELAPGQTVYGLSELLLYNPHDESIPFAGFVIKPGLNENLFTESGETDIKLVTEPVDFTKDTQGVLSGEIKGITSGCSEQNKLLTSFISVEPFEPVSADTEDKKYKTYISRLKKFITKYQN